MFLKISFAIVPQHRADDYLAYVRRFVSPRYRSAAGLVSIQLLRRPVVAYVEVLMLSAWRTQQALEQFAAIEPAIDRGGLEYGAIVLDARTYEVAEFEENDSAA